MTLLNPFALFPAAAGPTAYRYWRLKVTKWTTAGVDSTTDGFFSIPEFALYTAADVEYPTSNMTGNSSPSPLVASASSTYPDASSHPYFSFDGSSDDYGWTPDITDNNNWLQIDLGSAVAATYCKITPPSFVNLDTDGSYALRSFQVMASNTGSFGGEEVVRYSATDLALSGWTASAPRTFVFT